MTQLRFDIYSREHPPPHFHAIYAEYEELIEIESLEVYAGMIPKVQHKKVLNWAKGRKEFLLANFIRLNPKL